MGFYAPSQLVQDAQRHGVEMRPVDVLVSEWDCTLERGAESQPAIRLGLRMVKGLSEDAAQRLLEARRRLLSEPVNHEPRITSHESRVTNHSFLEHLARAAQLNRHDLNALAAAGALASVVGHRRQAVWAVTGIGSRPPVLEDAPIFDVTPPLPAPSEGQDLVADYASLGLTLGRHPLALLRPRLDRLRMVTAAQLKQLPHGKLTHAAGIVIGRQRPDTASGVIFVTLEDETGTINVVVWRDVADKQRRALLASQLLAVYGTLERQGEVVHLIAAKLADHSHLLGRLVARSRDFH
jgi:error-prone DNA polymerase